MQPTFVVLINYHEGGHFNSPFFPPYCFSFSLIVGLAPHFRPCMLFPRYAALRRSSLSLSFRSLIKLCYVSSSLLTMKGPPTRNRRRRGSRETPGKRQQVPLSVLSKPPFFLPPKPPIFPFLYTLPISISPSLLKVTSSLYLAYLSLLASSFPSCVVLSPSHGLSIPPCVCVCVLLLPIFM